MSDASDTKSITTPQPGVAVFNENTNVNMRNPSIGIGSMGPIPKGMMDLSAALPQEKRPPKYCQTCKITIENAGKFCPNCGNNF